MIFKQNTIMEKLISMTEFVLNQHEICPNVPTQSEAVDHLLNCKKYALFLKQPLTLGMFVPCDVVGNVLKEPKIEDYDIHKDIRIKFNFDNDLKRYNEIKEKVLFKNNLFIRDCGKHGISVETLKHDYVYNSKGLNTHKITEDLVDYGFELTESALKQIKSEQ
jgi:hypothetical protein